MRWRGRCLDTGLRRYDGFGRVRRQYVASLAAFLLLAGCAPTAPPLTEAELETYPESRGMPADVQHFMVRYQGCQHWLGEPDWDEARRRQIAQAVAEICPGLDAEGRRLRARHAANAEVLARLRGYEPLGQ